MSRNPVANLMYSFVAWLPILAVLGAVVWVLAVGVMNLEVRTYGSEFFVKNSETSNMPEWKMGGMARDGVAAGSQSDRLVDAINSGDPAQMQAALSAYEASAR